MSRPAQELALARRHVVDAEARIARQRELIGELRDCGYPTELAEDFLQSMLTIVETMRTHRDYLERKLQKH